MQPLRAERHAPLDDELLAVLDGALRSLGGRRPVLTMAVAALFLGPGVAALLLLAGASVEIGVMSTLLGWSAAIALMLVDREGRDARRDRWIDGMERLVVPALRDAVMGASPEHAERLARAVADVVRRHASRLPDAPDATSAGEQLFLACAEDPDNVRGVLAWLAARVCSPAGAPDAVLACPFFVALRRACAERHDADG